MSGCLDVWTECLDFCMSRSLDVWMSWCLDVWMSECLDVWMSECLDVYLSGCPDVLMSGCLDAWMSWCLDVQMSGCLFVWMSGCLDVWMSGFLDFRMAGWLNGSMSRCLDLCMRHPRIKITFSRRSANAVDIQTSLKYNRSGPKQVWIWIDQFSLNPFPPILTLTPHNDSATIWPDFTVSKPSVVCTLRTYFIWQQFINVCTIGVPTDPAV